jgi:hypothetical protein
MMIGCLVLLGALVIGGTADAKKKKKKKNATVTVTRTAPALIPARLVGGQRTLTAIPLKIGKKAKGKIVEAAGPKLTVAITGTTGEVNGDDIDIRLTAPNGRTVGVFNPSDADDAAFGPTTFTANSPVGVCNVIIADPPPPPPCNDPENTLLAPYVGEVGDASLALFNGIGAKGTWTLKVLNSSTVAAATLVSARLSVPTASKFK